MTTDAESDLATQIAKLLTNQRMRRLILAVPERSAGGMPLTEQAEMMRDLARNHEAVFASLIGFHAAVTEEHFARLTAAGLFYDTGQPTPLGAAVVRALKDQAHD